MRVILASNRGTLMEVRGFFCDEKKKKKKHRRFASVFSRFSISTSIIYQQTTFYLSFHHQTTVFNCYILLISLARYLADRDVWPRHATVGRLENHRGRPKLERGEGVV
jgi:hypothetical protein